MVRRWQHGFALLNLFLFLSISACGGGEKTGDNQPENQNQSECDPDLDPDCECDPLVHGECDDPTPDPTPGGCTADAECSGATPYCYTETNTCVSESFLCTLLNCAGQRGVCDAPSRSCVDAQNCSSTVDCLEGKLCIANSCESEDEVCSVCGPSQICAYDRNDLSISCENPVCEPRSRECDGDTLLACNSAGTALNEIFCIDGCDDEAGVCNLPQGDSCKTPLLAQAGQSVEIDWSYYSNQIEPDLDSGCFESAPQTARTKGPDVTFAFEIPAGQVGVATMRTPQNYGLLYLMEDCQEESVACTEPEGAQISEDDDEFVHTLWYFNDDDQPKTLLIVADSTDNADNAPATLDFELHSRVCDPMARTCEDSELSECEIMGTGWEFKHECDLGCHPEQEGQCASQIYTVCQDAVDADEDTFTFTGDMADLAPPAPFDTAELCERAPTSGAQTTFAGPVAYFRRALSTGERMTLSVAAAFDVGLWIATDCLDDQGQCKQAVNTELSGATESETLVYIAAEDEELIIAVQAVDLMAGESGEYTLDMLVESPDCKEQENGATLGCADEERLIYCTGSDYPSFHVCDGGCSNQACANPSGDRCFDAIEAISGQSYQGSFADQEQALRAPATCFGGVSIAQSGADTIYRVHIPNQHLLTALVKSPSANVGVYLSADCPNAGALSEDSCLATSFPSKSLERHFIQGGDYYLVVASKNAKESANFTLELDISPASCEPGNTVCADGVTRVCAENGHDWSEVETCAADCEEVPQGQTSRRCGALEKPNDQCQKSLAITGPSVIRGSFKDHKPRMMIHEDDCDEAGHSLKGPEAYYQVEMAPQTGLTAKVKTSANAYLMALESCGDASSCNIQKVGSDDELFEYYSPQGGTVFLVLKAQNANASQDFEIAFDYFEGECTPEIDTCETDEDDNHIAIACNTVGQTTTTLCEHGCFEGECLDKMGDLCHRPFDIDTDPRTEQDEQNLTFQHSGTLAGYGAYYDAYDPAEGKSCTGWKTPGREVVFAFKGWRNDAVDINLTSAFDGNIWITTDCEQAAATCVAGVDDTFGPGQESLRFEIKETNTYFIMVDGFQTGNSGAFELDVTIEKGERLEEAKIELDGTDELIFDLEVGQTGTGQFTISNLGGWDLPFEITHTSDWMSFDPAQGAVSSGATETIDLTFECESAGVNYGYFEIDYEAPQKQTIPLVLQVNCSEEEDP